MSKKWISAFLSLLLMCCLFAGASAAEDTVVVASKAHTEQYLLGEILALMIENHTDLQVDRSKIGLSGGGNILHEGLVRGDIDMYPEYTGTGWLTIIKGEPIRDPDEMYEKLKAAYLEQFQLEWLNPLGFNNTYAITMLEEKATELGLTTMSQLADHPELIFGANPDYYEREDGYPGLQTEYGFRFTQLVELDIALKFRALQEGQVDVINGFSTDAQLYVPGYTILQDDKNYFTAYYACPVVREETLEKHPELRTALGLLDGQITEEDMIRMNYQVEVDQMMYEDVAKEYLTGKGLI